MFRVGAPRRLRHVLVVAVLAVLGACGDQRPTAPAEPAATGSIFGPSNPVLVECPTKETKTESGTVISTLLETVVSIGGTRVVVPPGAAPVGTKLHLTIPASRYVEVRVRANDEEHFDFDAPIFVTIDYSRCERSDVLSKPVTAWYINADTKELIKDMEGIDNKLLQSITFETRHFSGYAIAF
jgi:hypothetical protein